MHWSKSIDVKDPIQIGKVIDLSDSEHLKEIFKSSTGDRWVQGTRDCEENELKQSSTELEGLGVHNSYLTKEYWKLQKANVFTFIDIPVFPISLAIGAVLLGLVHMDH